MEMKEQIYKDHLDISSINQSSIILAEDKIINSGSLKNEYRDLKMNQIVDIDQSEIQLINLIEESYQNNVIAGCRKKSI